MKDLQEGRFRIPDVRMNRETRVGTNGKAVTILTPESPEDQDEVVRLAAPIEIDAHHGFGDDTAASRKLRRDDAEQSARSPKP